MPNKKLVLLTIFVFCLLAVSQAYAADNATCDGVIGTDDDGQMILQENASDEVGFDDLKSEIDDVEKGGVLNLTRDYRYDGSPSRITVASTMTVDGDGHVLNANGMSRIFLVTADDVIIRDIIFVNGGNIEWDGNHGILCNCTFVNCSVGYGGGAIRWIGDCGCVINCSFVNCSTTDSNPMFRNGGGAIDCDGKNCSISECSFINCTSYHGGAVNGGYVFDCTFLNCSAFSGGALCGRDVSDCSFVNCTADFGGAVSCDDRYAHISNCSFTDCSSRYGGGAVMWNVDYGVILNCSFVNCSGDYGGAVYWNVNYSPILDSHDGVILYCSFVNCSGDYGGAVEWHGKNATVRNSSFMNCSADYGGAIYGGSAEDCRFFDNKANEGNNWYGTDVAKLNLTVCDFSSAGSFKKALFINATDKDGISVDDVIVTIRLYKNDTLIDTYECLTNTCWIADLDEGSYTAVMAVEHDSYELDSPVAVTLTLAKMPASSLLSTLCNIGKFLASSLKDLNRKVICAVKLVIVLNGNDYADFEVDTGCGELTVNVVKKATPKMTAKSKSFKYTVKTKKYTITLKTDRNKAMKNTKVTLKINNKNYLAKTNSKGVATFKITKLTKKGKYAAAVTYMGSSCYSKFTKNVKITVR